MDIFFSGYTLTPLKRANRLSSLDSKSGVYLKAVWNGTTVFADYFPHLSLGDRSVDQFLSEFKDQKHEYDRKLVHFLKKDSDYQLTKAQSFRNHQLWTGAEPLKAKVVKYKLMGARDRLFMEALQQGHILRLDGNGLFNQKGFQDFLASIPQEFHGQIQYVEDPLHELDWTSLNVSSAKDFVDARGAKYYIYKPNCEFYPEEKLKVIFSAYLGSDLGNWHTYCAMLEEGDLTEVQGIIAEGFYAEERGLFQGDLDEGVRPNMNVVKNIYQELHLRNWKSLCRL